MTESLNDAPCFFRACSVSESVMGVTTLDQGVTKDVLDNRLRLIADATAKFGILMPPRKLQFLRSPRDKAVIASAIRQ
jgi:hypothetical protein